jgi:hypothetical protein
MSNFKGIFGARYETAPFGDSVVVTKKDGKVFYIPIADWIDVGRLIEIEKTQAKLSDEKREIQNKKW